MSEARNRHNPTPTPGMRRSAEAVIARSSEDTRTRLLQATQTPLGYMALRVDAESEEWGSVRRIQVRGMAYDGSAQKLTVLSHQLWAPGRGLFAEWRSHKHPPLRSEGRVDLATYEFDYAIRPVTEVDRMTHAVHVDEFRTASWALWALRLGRQSQNPMLPENTAAHTDLLSLMTVLELQRPSDMQSAFPADIRVHFADELEAHLDALSSQPATAPASAITRDMR